MFHNFREMVLRHRVGLLEALAVVAVVFTAATLALFFELNGSLSGDQRIDLIELVAVGLVMVCSLGIFVWRRLVQQDREIVARKAAEQQARHIAQHDHLTGLPNRRALESALASAVAILPSAERSHVLLALDLNGFKQVNDVYGHPRGDEVLSIAATRMAGVLREGDLLARTGGDEFAVVARDVPGVEGAIALSEKLLEALSSPITIGADTHQVGTGIGIALIPRDGTDPDELLRKADIALYRAKADGQSTFAFFQEEMDHEARERDRLQRELSAAIGTDSLRPFYQPIVDLKSGGIRAFEALARWTHPELGEIAPDRFIPLAEEIQLIGPLTDHLLKIACRDARSWPADVVLSVNLSPTLLHDPGFPGRFLSIVAGSGLPLQRIELEITENAIVRDLEAARQVLGALRDAGVRIALDDFGTGATSLFHLRSFAFDVIKIDRSFIEHMNDERESAAIVRALLGLGRGLGVEIVAEGIEGADQQHMLEQEGCTTGQGFLFSEAVPADEAAKLVNGSAASKSSAA